MRTFYESPSRRRKVSVSAAAVVAAFLVLALAVPALAGPTPWWWGNTHEDINRNGYNKEHERISVWLNDTSGYERYFYSYSRGVVEATGNIYLSAYGDEGPETLVCKWHDPSGHPGKLLLICEYTPPD